MDERSTERADAPAPVPVERWRVTVAAGHSAGTAVAVEQGAVTVGTATDNVLAIVDAAVSRHHLEVRLSPAGARVRDLGSKNGSHYEGSRVIEVELGPGGGVITLGGSTLVIAPDAGDEPRPGAVGRCGRLLGRSDVMRALFALVEPLAALDACVLVQGETGTGKNLVAEALHELGARAPAPLVLVDCREGGAPLRALDPSDASELFVRAQRGTLVLDEIGELALPAQARLLHAIEEAAARRLDVRLVATSQRVLLDDVSSGRFREDLYFRISGAVIDVPPVRARLGDVALLARHFAAERGVAALPAPVLQVLRGHDWPGNVRQLRHAVELAIALGGDRGPALTRADLANTPGEPAVMRMPYKAAKNLVVDDFTREYLEALLARHQGNVSAAAREAGLDRGWITALARRLGVPIRD